METLEEIELVKSKLSQDDRIKDLGLLNWEVQEAYAPNDIDWHGLNKPANNNCCLPLLSVIVSTAMVFLLCILDQCFFDNKVVQLLAQYFCPLLLAFWALHGAPRL